MDNLAYIIKLANGMLIAVFTEAAFNPEVKSKGKTFIMSLTNQTIYHLKSGKIPLKYDDCYIIIGNHDIRIKSLEKSLFSNLGTS